MKKLLLPTGLLFAMQGCTTSFGGTVLVISIGDVVLYVIIALLLAFIIAMSSGNRRKVFWTWFIINLLLTPLVGLIYILIRVTTRKKGAQK